MFIVFIAAAALAVAVGVSAVLLVRRYRRVCRVLARERSARRLMEGSMHRDLKVFRSRMDQVLAGRLVLEEAGRVVDGALAAHQSSDPRTGGGSA